MMLLKPVMGVYVEIDGDVVLERGLEFLLEVGDKFGHPAVILVIFLAVGKKDVVVISRNQAGHTGLG